LSFRRGGFKLLEFHLDGGQVAINRLVQQAHLLAVELFAAPAELLAPEDRDLVSELLDAGLSEVKLTVPFADLPLLLPEFQILCLNLGHQLRRQDTQLLRIEGSEVGRQASLPEPHTAWKRNSLRP
jgi:hypothetical protein